MKNIHIALTFDDNYLEQSIVLMTSILANKLDEEKIFFHIVDGGLSDFSKEILWNMRNCSVEFHSVDENLFKGYIKTDYYPVSMLFTMILPDLIHVDKLLYLDSDMVVDSPLSELIDIDLEDNYIAAVEDANGKKYSKRYGLKPGSKFFNTGVMLINCNKWRHDYIPQRAVEQSLSKTGTSFGLDQTVLNILFEGKVKFINLKWNLQYCPLNVWATYDDKGEYKAAVKAPSIVHYVGDYKPWKQGFGCFNPKQGLYLKYHEKTCYQFEDYNLWTRKDKFLCLKGLVQFIKRYPVFFLKKQFWANLLSK